MKLSTAPEANLRPLSQPSPIGLLAALVATVANAHDQMHRDDPCVVARTRSRGADAFEPVRMIPIQTRMAPMRPAFLH